MILKDLLSELGFFFLSAGLSWPNNIVPITKYICERKYYCR